MKRLPQITALLMLTMSLEAQEDSQKELDFSLLRQFDNIDFSSGNKTGFYKNLKEINMGSKGILSFGGSYRTQAEAFINEEFSSELEQSDIWFLNRFQLHSHLKLNNGLEFFAELNSSLIASKQNLAPVDRDELSINQLFVKYHFGENWDFLVGRQNMRLGSGRLIDVREGPNVRLSFDMGQLAYTNEKTEVTAFHGVPVRLEDGIFDNKILDYQEWVSGVYWTQTWSTKNNTDIYAIYKEEDNKTWDSGTADDERLSIGLRHFGAWKELVFNNEFVYQTGSFGTQKIRAWTVSFNIEHPFPVLGQNSVIGLKTEAISGDTSNTDNSLNTFDGLYPRGAYFGRVARTGPSNLFDIHPYFDTKIGGFDLGLDYVAFWRLSRQDGVYGPPLNLQYPSLNEQRFIGHQIGTILSYEVNDFINLELETNFIFPGSFLIESNLDDTLFHSVVTAEFKF